MSSGQLQFAFLLSEEEISPIFGAFAGTTGPLFNSTPAGLPGLICGNEPERVLRKSMRGYMLVLWIFRLGLSIISPVLLSSGRKTNSKCWWRDIVRLYLYGRKEIMAVVFTICHDGPHPLKNETGPSKLFFGWSNEQVGMILFLSTVWYKLIFRSCLIKWISHLSYSPPNKYFVLIDAWDKHLGSLDL